MTSLEFLPLSSIDRVGGRGVRAATFRWALHCESGDAGEKCRQIYYPTLDFDQFRTVCWMVFDSGGFQVKRHCSLEQIHPGPADPGGPKLSESAEAY